MMRLNRPLHVKSFGKCNGIMAVPITALDKLDLEMFEIVGVLNKPVIKGKALYKRLLIRRRNLP